MKEVIEYIDAYFDSVLSEHESMVFEKRCLSDRDFAKEVAAYITARQLVQDRLNAQRKQRWNTLEQNQHIAVGNPTVWTMRNFVSKKWMVIAAAACVAVVLLIFVPGRSKDLRTESGTYIAQHLQFLGVTMGGEMDSVQQAISWYNQKQYDTAATMFSARLKRDSTEVYVLQYRGLSNLMLKKYDAALADFDQLIQYTGLVSNPGLFYKALCLLQRAHPGDVEAAEKLLREVVDQKSEGYQVAASFLE